MFQEITNNSKKPTGLLVTGCGGLGHSQVGDGIFEVAVQ